MKRKRHGEWIRLAARRFIKDLKRAQAKKPPFYFSPERANHACAFIEQLPHVEGKWETPTIRLEPFQVFFLVQLFGFRNLQGGRRFTTALFAIARKNAKSTLAAAILLYVFCCEPEQGPQILSAATTGDQARIVWGVAKRMVEKTPDLREAFTLEAFANAIARYEVGGTFKPINARSSTQDGLNPSALCFDELHAHKDHGLLNVLRSAAGARDNPLFLYTTTEGYETPGPWPEERAFAQQVLKGVIKADHYLAILYAVDDDDDDFDESKWVKANPLIEANLVLAAAIAKEALEAKQKPGALAEFRIKRLNRRSASADGWINLTKWRRCAGEVPLDELVGAPCWGAFDLASTTDMTAWWLLWLKDDLLYVWGRYWVPEEAVKMRTERGSVPYQAWIDGGWIKQTPGDVTDYSIIEADILEDCQRFAPRAVAYDPWNATQLAISLSNEGVPLQQFIQGPKSYNPGMTAFERAYTARRLRHGGNPVLTWNAANLVARRDVNNNMAPDRKRSAEKIDGIVCVLMDFALAEADDSSGFDEFLRNPVSA
jgi:phage terminase large subunit-like protein